MHSFFGQGLGGPWEWVELPTCRGRGFSNSQACQWRPMMTMVMVRSEVKMSVLVVDCPLKKLVGSLRKKK